MENTIAIGQAARMLGVTVKTLQRWEREGRLVPAGRTGSNRRRYTESQIRAHLGQRSAPFPTRIVAYCRVSSAGQRPDLADQRAVLEQFCAARGLAGVEFIQEVGGGLNFSRPHFVSLMDAIGGREVATLVLAHRDRLTRFGFDWFAHYAETEPLRFAGRIMGATVQREAGHWHVAVQVEVPDAQYCRARTDEGVVGVDLGITAAAYLSTGEAVASPRPLKAALRRLRIRSRRASRKHEAAKKAAGITGAIPKGTRLAQSNNQVKGARALARLHARIAAVRRDFTHKLTTRLCRENQAIVIEDLHVKGMLKNERLARHMSDIGFGRIRAQLEYKAARYGTRLVVAERWFPSSKLCSTCGVKNTALLLRDRSWTCACGALHQRDHNAAINLQRLAAGAAPGSRNALPVASSGVTRCVSGTLPGAGGEVTPARNEYGPEDGSGREENAAHLCAHF